MKYQLQKTFFTIGLFCIVWIWIAQWWSWLIASSGDVITATKWNEMINKILPISASGSRVWIGDTSPDHTFDVAWNIGLNASSYINFWDTDWTTGYWFRDNAWTLQFKNSAWGWANIPITWWVGDDLGNHTASQNIALSSFWLSGDGWNEGITVDSVWKVWIWITPSANLHSSWSVRFDLWSDATNDIFYRSSGWNLARLAIGSTGTTLKSVSTWLAWIPAFSSYLANGTDSDTTATRDLNAWVTSKWSSVVYTDVVAAPTNPPNGEAAWFNMGIQWTSWNYYWQLLLNDHDAYFRGWSNSSITANDWRKIPSFVAFNKFTFTPSATWADSDLTLMKTWAFALAFWTNNTEQMRITSTGAVGIGDTSPANKFEITSWTGGNSGLRFTNLPSSTATTTWAINGKNLTVNGSGDVILVDELRQRVILAADGTANSTTTFASVNWLSFTWTVGLRYQFDCTIWYTAALATTGSRWAITWPTFAVLAYSSTYANWAAASFSSNSVAYNTATASTNSASTTWNVARIYWFITPTATGLVTVRFASEIAASAITPKAWSTCEYWNY